MKTLLIAILTLSFSAYAQAEQITGTDGVQINAAQIDGHKIIPNTGDLMGSVVSVYAGSAYGLESYVVTIGNTAVPCEGDDCIASKTFELWGSFQGAAKEVYSRKIDANTYSVAILTKQVDVGDGSHDPIFKNVKILLRVTFNDQGVSEVAEMQIVPR